MAGFKSDGSTPVNTRVLTIGPAAGGIGGTAYVAENFSVDRTAKNIERTDENDEPKDQYSYKSFTTGSATLQANTGANVPLQGWEFTTSVDAATGNEVFYIFTVAPAESQGQAKKYNVTFRKKYN